MTEFKTMNYYCYKCQKSIPVLGSFKISRSEECPFCNVSLHCCKMCKFFDMHSYNECRETIAERILDKEKANFCDYFEINENVLSGNKKEDLLSAADSLFKK